MVVCLHAIFIYIFRHYRVVWNVVFIVICVCSVCVYMFYLVAV